MLDLLVYGDMILTGHLNLNLSREVSAEVVKTKQNKHKHKKNKTYLTWKEGTEGGNEGRENCMHNMSAITTHSSCGDSICFE